MLHAEAHLPRPFGCQRRVADGGVEIERVRRLVVRARISLDRRRFVDRVTRPQARVECAVGVLAPVKLIEAEPGVQLPAAQLHLRLGEFAEVAERLAVRHAQLLRDRRSELP